MGCTHAPLFCAVFDLEWIFWQGRESLILPQDMSFTLDFYQEQQKKGQVDSKLNQTIINIVIVLYNNNYKIDINSEFSVYLC